VPAERVKQEDWFNGGQPQQYDVDDRPMTDDGEPGPVVAPCIRRGGGTAGLGRGGTSGGVPCLPGDAAAFRDGKGGRVSYPGEEAV
jgi:hypothetical protein